jgi:hypothetical protein
MSEFTETPFTKLRNLLSPAKNLAEIVIDYRRPATTDTRWDELMNDEAKKSRDNFAEIIALIDLLESQQKSPDD